MRHLSRQTAVNRFVSKPTLRKISWTVLLGAIALTPVLSSPIKTTAQGNNPQRICPALCRSRGLTWAGTWQRRGNSILCQCSRASNTPAPPPSPTPPTPPSVPTSPGATTGSFTQQLLDTHNKYRAAVGVPALTWSAQLANDAQGWANYLASLGGRRLEHSQNNQRPGQGENLWLGTSGAYSPVQMVDSWGAEQQFFRPGNFPNVSTSGNWADVGHYTQMIWRNTTQVGCGIAKAGGNDILVCRYSPAGNFMGQRVY